LLQKIVISIPFDFPKKIAILIIVTSLAGTSSLGWDSYPPETKGKHLVVYDIAMFVLKRDVTLPLTNFGTRSYH